MPLGEIKAYMQERSPGLFLTMMDQQERQIDQEIKRLRSMKQFIRHEKQNVQEALDVRLDEPYLVRREECWLLLSDVKGREERKLAEEIAQHVRLREQYRVTQSAVEMCIRDSSAGGRGLPPQLHGLRAPDHGAPQAGGEEYQGTD